MSGLLRLAAALAIVVATVTPASAQEPVPAGHVKTVAGTATIVRAGQTLPAKPGAAIYATDTLRTAADGTVGVTLRDDTRISLGPGSEVRIERYVYAPGEGGLGMVLQVHARDGDVRVRAHGQARAGSIRLETPTAIVGVRGTTVAIRVGA